MGQVDQASDDSDAVEIKNEAPTEKRALARVERRLNDEELKHPGVQKMILDRLDVAEETILTLEKFRSDYYETKSDLAVSESALKRITSLDTLQSATLGVGCLILGYLPTAWGNWPLTFLAFFGGVVLVGGSVWSKRGNQ
ncbi:putative uncharacterized protein [Pseudomonas sp. Os17]|uniref:hypothetical protein n=1 Tax=Pseudomonas sp. Os17 TaxID=1500686 RepID=UPI0005FC700D|nr:hypothetical protein [Pseudomonas sp. Os17]BAQ75130.1 putative uncharacterized protein [Pseudomonas sp. Os17]